MEKTEIYKVIIIECNTLFYQTCGASDCKAHSYFTYHKERKSAANETGMPSVVICILFSEKSVCVGGSMS